ncbi:glycosyltransferase [Streptomyces sp. RPT161]|uniref:glycosyltransferase n=1 Tax=Streptomyces sp. RPT161 TaxID=3015993 RepID=UPI0022B8B3A3|nr:glycosyltransferase [Streptomyces sp. RPT161]
MASASSHLALLQRAAGNAAVTRSLRRGSAALALPLQRTESATAVRDRSAGQEQGPALGVAHPFTNEPIGALAEDGVITSYLLDAVARGRVDQAKVIVGRLPELDPEHGRERALRFRRTIEEAASTSLGPQEKQPIPPLVHFFWIGRKMGRTALANIHQWADCAANSGWKIWIWTDGATDWGGWFGKKPWDRGEIEKKDVTTALDQRVAGAYRRAVQAGAYPTASDLARYSILHRYGGVYADVDLGVGRVRLGHDVPRLSAADVPVLGPHLRDRKNRSAALGDAGFVDGPDRTEGDRTAAAAEHLYGIGAYGNQFFAAQRGSAVMDRMLDHTARRTADADEDALKDGAAMLTGPYALWNVLQEYARTRTGLADLKQEDLAHLQPDGASSLHRGISWLTEESENQEYEHG